MDERRRMKSAGSLSICSNGHYYDGVEYNRCPYCPREYASIKEIDSMANHELAVQMMAIPICKHCGRPLRKGIPRPPYREVVSSLHDIRDHIVPWNYEWNGKCEHCEYDYNVYMRTPTGSRIDNRYKYTAVKCSNLLALHHITANSGECEATGFSGVEIETWFDNGKHDKVFLSANEIKYLFNALNDSPMLSQYNYLWGDYEKIQQYT